MKLVFVSNNKNKVSEVSSILPERFEVVTLYEVAGHVDIEETADTLEGNAEIKADYIWDKFGISSFADDTGLEVESLNNQPGVRSARYAGESKKDEDNMNKLLDELSAGKSRKARFRTVVCFIHLSEKHFFEGVVEGRISESKKGANGFGYDPIFIPDGYDKTFAEMESNEKNSLSHRRRAIDSFVKYINEQMNEVS